MLLHDVIQANRKDLQRFLGLNDDNEMVSEAQNKPGGEKSNLTKYFCPGLHSQRAQTTAAGFSQQGAGDAIRYSFVRPGARDIRCTHTHTMPAILYFVFVCNQVQCSYLYSVWSSQVLETSG